MQLALSSIGRRITRTIYMALTEEVQHPSPRTAPAVAKRPAARPSMLDRDDPTDEDWSEVDWSEVSRLAVGYMVLRGLPRTKAQRMADKVAQDADLQSQIRRKAGHGADEMTLANTLAMAV